MDKKSDLDKRFDEFSKNFPENSSAYVRKMEGKITVFFSTIVLDMVPQVRVELRTLTLTFQLLNRLFDTAVYRLHIFIYIRKCGRSMFELVLLSPPWVSPFSIFFGRALIEHNGESW